MAGPLNVQARGLLSLFDLKGAGGRYPGELGETILPTLELRDWLVQVSPLEYASDAGTVLNVDTASAVVSSGSNLLVPPGEIWYVNRHWVVASFTAAAASTLYSLLPVVQVPLGAAFFGTVLRSDSTPTFTNLVAVNSNQIVSALHPYFAVGGSIICARHGGFDFGASVATISSNIEFLRLKV